MQIKNPLQWDIQQNNESLIVRLSGKLTRNTLFPLWKQRASFLLPKANQHIYWDLKNLETIDSAGFALLTDLLNHYQKNNPNIVINQSESIIKLAELFDLSQWLAPFLASEGKNNLWNQNKSKNCSNPH